MPDEGLSVETRGENLLAVKFTAMASPCEVLLPSMSKHAALAIGTVAAQEAWRVEKKYSRYRDDSVTAWIHANRGTSIELDEETASLVRHRCGQQLYGSRVTVDGRHAARRWGASLS